MQLSSRAALHTVSTRAVDEILRSTVRMSVEEDNKARVRRFIDFINNDNSAPIDEFFATSYTYHNSSMPEVKDLSGVKAFNAMAYNAFPDIRFTIEDMVAEGDKVVYRASARGTHKGEFMGIAPTSKQITVTSIVISRIAHGKFQEDWESLDGIYLLQQLGAIPQPIRVEG
jgi:predicted ester cyclase